MKAIMMSIQPQWVAKILNGEKNIEIRKRFPINYVGWVYVYCTKGKPQLGCHTEYKNNTRTTENGYRVFTTLGTFNKQPYFNGKVVARFWCDRVTKLEPENSSLIKDYWADHDIVKNACLTRAELWDYGQGKPLYAIHITKLEIFDTPKELKEFNVWRKKTIYSGMDCPPYVDDVNVPLTRSPRNWCWVEGEKE